jgi:hypothetical protein
VLMTPTPLPSRPRATDCCPLSPQQGAVNATSPRGQRGQPLRSAVADDVRDPGLTCGGCRPCTHASPDERQLIKSLLAYCPSLASAL